MLRTSFLILLAVAITPVHADDLLSVYQQALDNDPELRAAEAGHQATLLNKDKARALLLPNANLSANATEIREDSSINTDTNFSDTGVSLTIKQPVFHYDAFVQREQADISIQQSESELSATQQSVMLKVAERYFELLSAQTALEFSQSEKTAIAKQLEQAQKRFDVGLIAITDVHEAQAAYDLAVASEITAHNLLANTIEALSEITGSTHPHLAKLGTDLPLLRPDPDNMDTWTEVALKQNRQLQSLDLSTQIARQDIRLKRAGHYPTLDVVARSDYSDSGRTTFSTTTGSIRPGAETLNNSIALELNVPLFSGGLTSAQVKESAFLYNQARENLEKERRAVLRQTRDAYRGVINGIGQVKALKQATVSNNSALETTQAGFEVGTRTIVDVLLAQRGLFGAKRDYNQARHQYILNILRLKQAAGTLSPDDLKRFNQWLEK